MFCTARTQKQGHFRCVLCPRYSKEASRRPRGLSLRLHIKCSPAMYSFCDSINNVLLGFSSDGSPGALRQKRPVVVGHHDVASFLTRSVHNSSLKYASPHTPESNQTLSFVLRLFLGLHTPCVWSYPRAPRLAQAYMGGTQTTNIIIWRQELSSEVPASLIFKVNSRLTNGSSVDLLLRHRVSCPFDY